MSIINYCLLHYLQCVYRNYLHGCVLTNSIMCFEFCNLSCCRNLKLCDIIIQTFVHTSVIQLLLFFQTNTTHCWHVKLLVLLLNKNKYVVYIRKTISTRSIRLLMLHIDLYYLSTRWSVLAIFTRRQIWSFNTCLDRVFDLNDTI